MDVLKNFSWISFFIGVAFALFVWPFITGLFASKVAPNSATRTV